MTYSVDHKCSSGRSQVFAKLNDTLEVQIWIIFSRIVAISDYFIFRITSVRLFKF